MKNMFVQEIKGYDIHILLEHNLLLWLIISIKVTQKKKKNFISYYKG